MIAVTTPTGHIGSRVVQLPVQAGVRPRALARDPARLDDEVRQRVEASVGDLTDAAFLDEALRGTTPTTLAAWAHAHRDVLRGA